MNELPRRFLSCSVIVDTGIGIAAGHLAQLFERFYRADISRTRDTGGAGLGLSICKVIVESHGGQITVESEVGEGSQFLVRLPRVDQ